MAAPRPAGLVSAGAEAPWPRELDAAVPMPGTVLVIGLITGLVVGPSCLRIAGTSRAFTDRLSTRIAFRTRRAGRRLRYRRMLGGAVAAGSGEALGRRGLGARQSVTAPV